MLFYPLIHPRREGAWAELACCLQLVDAAVGGRAATLAYRGKGAGIDVLVLAEVLGQSLLGAVFAEGMCHDPVALEGQLGDRLLQLFRHGKGDLLGLDVLAGDALGRALALAGAYLERQCTQRTQLHAVAVAEGTDNLCLHGGPYGQHIGFVGGGGVVDALGHVVEGALLGIGCGDADALQVVCLVAVEQVAACGAALDGALGGFL